VISAAQVETVPSGIRPFLEADGLNIEVISTDGNSATAHLTLPPGTSPGVLLTLWSGIEEGLRARIPGFDSLRLS
jgi:Fe-S cluster biogenesis protein NfuA